MLSVTFLCIITFTGSDQSTPLLEKDQLWYSYKDGFFPDFKYKSGNISFEYDSAGLEWEGTCGSGKAQSPIPFSEPKSQFCGAESPQSFYFVNYDQIESYIAVGTFSPVISYKTAVTGLSVGIAGGKLQHFYKFHSGHFHWPSEHVIARNKERHALELHLVHYDPKYKSLDEAVHSKDKKAIAVIGVVYDIGPADHNVQILLEAVKKATSDSGQLPTTALSMKINVSAFLPDNHESYVRYSGSLTTPPCSEVVIWTVFSQIKTMSKSQLEQISNLQIKKTVETYRSFQKIHSRHVYTSSIHIPKVDLVILTYMLAVYETFKGLIL